MVLLLYCQIFSVELEDVVAFKTVMSDSILFSDSTVVVLQEESLFVSFSVFQFKCFPLDHSLPFSQFFFLILFIYCLRESENERKSG